MAGRKPNRRRVGDYKNYRYLMRRVPALLAGRRALVAVQSRVHDSITALASVMQASTLAVVQDRIAEALFVENIVRAGCARVVRFA